MAFEMILTPRRRSRSRAITAGLSLVVHVAVLGGLTVRSFWDVDEVTPPAIRIEFDRQVMAAPPPLPEPPKRRPSPAPPSSDRMRRTETRTPVPPEPTRPSSDPATLSPTETAPSATAEIGTDATMGRDRDVCPAGESCAAGAGDGPVVPPQIAASRCLACPDPSLPAPFRRLGGERTMLAKICVGSTGVVQSVRVVRGIDPSADPGIVATLQTWRFASYAIDGRPVPFCYVAVLRFITQ